MHAGAMAFLTVTRSTPPLASRLEGSGSTSGGMLFTPGGIPSEKLVLLTRGSEQMADEPRPRGTETASPRAPAGRMTSRRKSARRPQPSRRGGGGPARRRPASPPPPARRGARRTRTRSRARRAGAWLRSRAGGSGWSTRWPGRRSSRGTCAPELGAAARADHVRIASKTSR